VPVEQFIESDVSRLFEREAAWFPPLTNERYYGGRAFLAAAAGLLDWRTM
jgi:hypothetical protein